MLIHLLRVEAFRRFDSAEIALRPGFNLLTGDNGSGKTSVLEALHLLAHGRSFRGRVRDGLIRQGEPALQAYVEWEAEGVARRAGLRHAGGSWEARLDGEDVRQLGQLCEALAVITFEPGSHALVDGSAEVRRRYLDWGLFHVEHGFMPQWRRYARALKQRNALLRQTGGASAQLDAWEHELAQSGEELTLLREAYVTGLQPSLTRLLPNLLPAAGGVELLLQPGWKRQELSLADALLLSRERDLALGYTSLGPHRADLRISLRDLPGREGLSRGQTKQLALALLLGQAAHLAALGGGWPALQLDDLGSELDRHHQRRLLEVLAESGAQVLITGTEAPVGLAAVGVDVAMFHVEHGKIGGA
ncbi:DNA replication/repair protein RecF [Thermomonas fusca]|uniref:DNA replication and repair protein RecF n=1 Tax=Thermomonas fusca TaxID=215690 RepID=A0A5R9PGP3_9GAMM|nr:DNA replication/repair protein RecF [Thermomonas fusca]